MAIFVSHSEAETEAIGKRLGQSVNAGSVVALYGGLGMGKTALTRGIAAGLGIHDPVSSPTFTLVNEYGGGRLPLFHFDMYRLKTADELFDIGWEEYLERGGVCVLEWSERVEEALDGDCIRVELRRIDENSREIRIGEDGI